MHEFKFAKKYGRMAALLMMTFFSICCIIGGLLSGFKSENYVDMLLKFNTWTYQQSAVMFFISTIPAVIDLILDMTQMNEICIFCPKYIGRVLITISCFIVSIQFKVLDITPSIFNMTTNRSLSYISSLFCLRLVLACSMLLILMVNNDRIFTFLNVFCINAFVCIATVMKFFTLTSTGTVHIGTLIFTQIGLIFVIFMFIVWIYRMCTTIKIMTVNDYTCILYFITAFIVGTMTYLSIMQKLVTGNYVDTGISHYNDKELAFANYALTVLSIILTVVSSRISRYEAYVYMKNNIKTKTEYVRFISHELRTPLNSVFLGLNLSISQIPEHTDNEENKERRDTLVEIASACSAALDILNQLLLFDKLDNGILELNKSKTRVTELIHDAIKMFTVQIREKNIDMKIQNKCPGILSTEKSYIALLDRLSPHLSVHINGGSNTTKLNSYSIYSNEMIEIDKNKMIQVIRNIVSNAIKFTPEYGQISINLKFEINPDLLVTNEKGDNKRVFPVKKTKTMIGITDVFSKLNTVIIHDNHLTNSSSTSPTCEDIGRSIECSPTSVRDIYSYPSYLPTTNDSTSRTLSDHVITIPRRSDDDSNHKLENEISISPRVYGDSVEGYLVIEVTDTGAGISEENQLKLFREIVQFNPEILQNGGGSGLGMWISKGIVDLHGGKISVSSEGEGRGSTFTIKLPMIRVYDESIMSSSKLAHCIHIRDHTSLNLIQMSSLVPSLDSMKPNRGVMADPTAVRQEDIHVDDICNTSQNNITDESSTFPRHRSFVGDVMVDTYRSELSESNNVFTEYAFRSCLLAPQQTSMMISSPFIYSSSSSSSTTSSYETMKSHSLSISPILHSSTLLPSSSSSSMIESHQDTSQHMMTFDVSDSETILMPSFRIIHDVVDIISTSTNDLNTLNEVYNSPIISSQNKDIILKMASTSISSQCNQSSHDPLIDHLYSSPYALKTDNQYKNSLSTKEKKTILVVDDSSMNRKMLCRLLKSSGYICIQANDGVEAVTYIRNSLQKKEMCDSCQITSMMTSSPVTSSAKKSTISTATLKHDNSYKSMKHPLSYAYIDCIIMDFMMPHMDGPTATAEIRKLGYTGPIIGATGNALQADIDYFIEKGATKVLVKPLDMSSVLSSIQTP